VLFGLQEPPPGTLSDLPQPFPGKTTTGRGPALSKPWWAHNVSRSRKKHGKALICYTDPCASEVSPQPRRNASGAAHSPERPARLLPMGNDGGGAMASDITLAVGGGARRMTCAELAAAEGYRCPRRVALSYGIAGRGKSAMTALSE